MIQNKKKAKKNSKNTRMKISFVLTKQQKIIWGAFLFILGIALFLSFISYFFPGKQIILLLVILRTEKILLKIG